MSPWLALAAIAIALTLLLAGYYLGQRQSSSALSAAATVSSMMNKTSERLFQADHLAPAVTATLEHSRISRAVMSRRFRELRRETTQASARTSATVQSLEVSNRDLTVTVDRMGETLTQMLSVFVQRGLIRMETEGGYQAGEVAPKPSRLPADAIKTV